MPSSANSSAIARGHNFYLAIFGIADPALQSQSRCFAVDEPAKTDALNPSLHEVVSDHHR